MKKRILSLLCTIVFVLNFIGIIPAHADEAEDFQSYFENYDKPDTFVADVLLGRVHNANGVPSVALNITNFGYTINQREYAFETVGKDMASNWVTYLTPVYWSSIKNTLKFRIYDIPNWEDFVYEILIIDFLAYNYSYEIGNSSQFKDNMMDMISDVYDKACEEGDDYLIKELEKINKEINDIQNDNSLDAALKSSKLQDANLEKDKVTDYLKTTENGRVLLSIASKAADVVTSGLELLEAVNKIKTVKQVNESRIRFLKSMINNSYGDKHFINAAKNVLSYYYVNNTDDYDMVNRQYMSLTKPGLDYFSRNIIIGVVEAVESSIGSTIMAETLLALNLSALAVDLLFNVTDKSQCTLQLNLINIMHYYAVAAYRDALYTYVNDSTEENASYFIDAYKQLLSFKCYGNTILKKYLETNKSFNEDLSMMCFGTNFSELADNQIHVNSLNYLKTVSTMYEIYYQHKINYTNDNPSNVIPITGISLDTENITIDMSSEQSVAIVYDLGLRVYPDNATNKLLHYHIHDADIVEIVKSGDWSYIFPIGVGSTVITFETYDGGYTVDLAVTVIASDDINNDFVCNIDDYAYSIDTDEYGNDFICIDAYYDENGQNKVEIPSMIKGLPVKIIGEGAFEYHTELTDVIIPDTVTNIRFDAFFGCENLINVRLSENLEHINGGAFFGCKSIQEIYLPDSLCGMGESVFSNCTNLKSINIPRNMHGIPSYTFSNCTSLESITIPDTVEYLDDGTFYSCTNLKSVRLPEYLVKINYSCFKNCESLDNIILHNIDSIYDDAFKGCKSLKNISILDNYTSIEFSEEALGNPSITTITCMSDSTVLEYAKNLGYNYRIVPDKGDVNLDGKLTVLDLVILNKYLHDSYYFNYSQYDYADINNDGKINIYDYISLKKRILKDLSETKVDLTAIYKTEYKKLLTSLALEYKHVDNSYTLDYCLCDWI